jgi:hypothetical protein
VADYALHPIAPEDAPALRRLGELQGRNVHADEYARFLGLEGAGGWLLREGDEVLAGITALRCFEHGVLGPLLARAELPSSLEVVVLSHAVEALQRSGVARVEVEATEREAQVLERMGFARVRGTLVLERAPGALAESRSPPAEGGAPAPMGPEHLLDVGILDAAAVGHGRKGYLADVQAAFPDGSLVVERDGDVAGFALLRRSRRGYHLGPLVTLAEAPDDAAALLEAAVARVSTWPVTALAPEGTPLLARFEALGFAPVGRLVRLRAGEAPPEATAREWLLGSRLTG